MNASLPKSLKRAVVLYLTENYDDVYWHVEGDDRETQGKEKWLELRTNGPDRSGTRNSFTVNILICWISPQNTYAIQEIAGQIASLLDTSIPVVDDEGALLGCLSPEYDGRHKLEITNYGVIDKDLKMEQSTVTQNFVITEEDV